MIKKPASSVYGILGPLQTSGSEQKTNYYKRRRRKQILKVPLAKRIQPPVKKQKERLGRFPQKIPPLRINQKKTTIKRTPQKKVKIRKLF